MPITDLDSRFRELGRLRLGEDLGDRPTALDVWRLTSPHLNLLEAAANIYGGTVIEWGDGYELKTDTAELEVLLPPQDIAAGQWLELWRGSQISRRCDGINLVEAGPGGFTPAGPCQCDPSNRECKPTTVLRVVLPNLPDLGVWRLVTRSYHAALELPGSAELLLRLTDGRMAPAVLALELRRDSTRRPFVVPVLRSALTLRQLQLFSSGEEALASLAPTASPPLTAPPAEEEAITSPLPSPAEPKTLDWPALAPHSPQNGRKPEPPTPMAAPLPAEWEALGRLLAANEPSTVAGRHSEELIEALGAIEAAMVDVGLWSIRSDGALPLDVVALDKFPDDELGQWRGNVYKTHRLRTFAERVLIDACGRFANHQLGRRVLEHLREEEAPQP